MTCTTRKRKTEDRNYRRIKGIIDVATRNAWDMICANELIYDFLGYPCHGDDQALRNQLQDRIHNGEFLPFDADAQRRLMTLILEDY